MLLQWLILLEKQLNGNPGELKIERKEAAHYHLHVVQPMNLVNPYMKIRLKGRGENIKVSAVILPGIRFLIGAGLILGLIIFSALVNLGSKGVFIAVLVYLILLLVAFRLAAGKLSSFRGILFHIAAEDEFPED